MLIPIVAIPISLIGAVFLMLVFGFTINLLTLLAIVLSVGLVVDDAIVMVENVERHLQLGEKPFDAAMKAARELVGPIIAMTITLAAVYAPIGIQGGLTGALFREFAFTLAGAVIVSGVVALTLSPMMGSKLLRSGDSEKGFAGWINRRFDGSGARTPERSTAPSSTGRSSSCSGSIVVAAHLPVLHVLAEGARADRGPGVVFGVIQAAPNATLDQTKLFATKVYDVYDSFPENEGHLPDHLARRAASAAWSPSPGASARRARSSSRSRRAGLSKIPGRPRDLARARRRCRAAAAFPWTSSSPRRRSPSSWPTSRTSSSARRYQSGLFMFADSDLKFDQPQAEVVFDRDKLRAQGVDLAQAGKDLSTMLGGNYVNRFSIQGRSYKVIPQIKRAERLDARSALATST